MPPPVCTARAPRVALCLRRDRNASPHGYRHRALSAVPPGSPREHRHAVSPGTALARAARCPPALRCPGTGTSLSLCTDVPHAGTLPVCLRVRGPLEGDQRGARFAREETGRTRPVPPRHALSWDVQSADRTCDACDALHDAFQSSRGQPPRPSGFLQFILCVVQSVPLRELSLDPARHIRCYSFWVTQNL